MNQLTFSLLDLCQLGDIVPFYNTATKLGDPDRHEVHDYSDKLLVRSLGLFQDKYNELVDKLGGDEQNVTTVKGDLYQELKAFILNPEPPTTLITEENIHEVKVVLYDRLQDATKNDSKWKYSAFRILRPHKLPEMLNRETAKKFFDAIKEKRNLVDGTPLLSWWLLEIIETRYLAIHGD